MRTSRFYISAVFMVLALVQATPALAQQAGPSSGANTEARLQSVEEQMRTLNGRFEQLEFSIKRLDQAMQRQQSDIDARFARIESAPPPPTTSIAPSAQGPATASIPSNIAPNTSSAAAAAAAQTAAESEPVASGAPVNGSLGAIKMQDGKVTGAVKNPQSPPLPPTPPDYGLTPQEQYDRAFDLLREASYDDAGEAFKTFIEKNPQDKLIDAAKYWYGETLYVRSKFDASAVAFAEAYQQDPKGGKAPDSLLKMALSLENLDKTADACATLDSLKGKFPNAAPTIRQRSEQEYAKMKCSSATPAAASGAPAKKHY